MRLIFVRHGESVWNREGRIQGLSDPPLNDRGRAQAALVAERLVRDFKPAALYSSALQRATETAQIVADRLNLPLSVDARLNEYDIGEITGMTDEEVAVRFPEIWKRFQEDSWWVPMPGEEGLYHFLHRIHGAMQDILEAHADDGEVVVVTHGGVMSVYIGDLIGMNVRLRLPFVFDNASISIIQPNPARPRILRLNDVGHLSV